MKEFVLKKGTFEDYKKGVSQPGLHLTRAILDALVKKGILETEDCCTYSVVGGGGGGGATDLTSVTTTTNVTIASSTGTDAVIPAASSVNAGVMTTIDFNLNQNNGLVIGASGAANLGTFPGSIISNNTTIKTALTELEAAIGAAAGNTDLSFTRTATTVTVVSSTGNDAVLPAASTTQAGVMPASSVVEATDVRTLTGTAVNAVNLGTFTGGTIPDNLTIKAALQSLETAVEAAGGSGLSEYNVAITGGNANTSLRVIATATGITCAFASGTYTMTLPANCSVLSADFRTNPSDIDTASDAGGVTNRILFQVNNTIGNSSGTNLKIPDVTLITLPAGAIPGGIAADAAASHDYDNNPSKALIAAGSNSFKIRLGGLSNAIANGYLVKLSNF